MIYRCDDYLKPFSHIIGLELREVLNSLVRKAFKRRRRRRGLAFRWTLWFWCGWLGDGSHSTLFRLWWHGSDSSYAVKGWNRVNAEWILVLPAFLTLQFLCSETVESSQCWVNSCSSCFPLWQFLCGERVESSKCFLLDLLECISILVQSYHTRTRDSPSLLHGSSRNETLLVGSYSIL